MALGKSNLCTLVTSLSISASNDCTLFMNAKLEPWRISFGRYFEGHLYENCKPIDMNAVRIKYLRVMLNISNRRGNYSINTLQMKSRTVGGCRTKEGGNLNCCLVHIIPLKIVTKHYS
jgi:hypothetical protein